MRTYLIIGLGRFGISFGKTIFEMGQEVLGIDINPDIVQDCSSFLTHTIEANATSEEFLKSIDVDKFDAVVVAIGSNFQVNIMITVLLKELGAKHIIAKAIFGQKFYMQIGADRYLFEKDIGISC